MAHLFEIEAPKTYATKENAVKAVEKKFGKNDETEGRFRNLRYFIMQNDQGRYFPVFVGAECITEGVHFHFNVVG